MYFSHNYCNYSMFRDVPECSMFLLTAREGCINMILQREFNKKIL